MLKRINIYLNEMYPIIPGIIFSLVCFYSVYSVAFYFLNEGTIVFNLASFAGAATFFLFALFLRISDEFKDYETDLILFPKRPLPSGRVFKKDLYILMAVTIILMFLLNILFTKNILFFIILFVYSLLMFKYFFARKYISKSLILALVTHNPIVLILNLYIISILCHEYNKPLFTRDNIVVAIIFWAPMLAWELSRKIKAPQDENDYPTYSMIFGYRISAMLPAFILFIQMLIILILIDNLFISVVFKVILVANFLFYIIIILRFLLNPCVKTSNLKLYTEIYTVVFASIIIYNAVIK